MENNVNENLDNLNRFLDKLGYFKCIDDNDMFENFIQGLTVDQFKNILMTFNAKLRDIKTKEKGFNDEGYMAVDGWFSPSVDAIQELLPELLDNIKKLDDNKERATLTYYTLLDLHAFKDGNGRTSRVMYDLLNNSYDPFDKEKLYFHDKNNNRKYNGTFETKRNIMPIYVFNYYSTFKLDRTLDKYGIKLDDIMKETTITTYGSGFVDDIELECISDEIKSQLTDEELQNIKINLNDSDGRYSVGGLIMTIMATKKGNLDKWKESNNKKIEEIAKNDPEYFAERKKRFIFSLDDNKELFDSWSVDDFKEVITIGNEIKKEQIIGIMDIFMNSDKYVFDDGSTLKEHVLNSKEKSY